jgi:hypothetical protein
MKKSLLIIASFIAIFNLSAQVNEDFSTVVDYEPIGLTGWTNFNEAGTRTWQGRYYATETNYYAQTTAYNSGEASEIMWMITPGVIADGTSTLNFRSKYGYNVADVASLWISTNFAGDVTAATWTELTFTEPQDGVGGYGAWTPSGNIDLSSYNGTKFWIAFKYTGGDPGATTTWQVDDVVITGTGTGVNTVDSNLGIYPNPANFVLNVNSSSSISQISVSNVIGQRILAVNDVNSKNYTLDIRNLRSGVYVIAIRNNDGSVSISKFVKE